uniref:Smr domain-containing protein YPL199C n=1 Tax=Anthurium amnicola TaxID=1678845 RepID=A0A1D1ZG18_9ARAE
MTSMMGPFNSKIRRRGGKSPGWAAFDHKQRKKEYTEHGHDVDPFPPVSKVQGPKPPMNHQPPTRSFSSVVRPPMDFPSIVHCVKVGNLDDSHNRESNDVVSDQISMETNAMTSIKILKSLNVWADESLIEDILAAVNNNEEQASALLKAMVSNDFSKEDMELKEPSTVLKDHISNDYYIFPDQRIYMDNQSADDPWKKLASMNLLSAPVEPEWEVDDVYLSCRKDPIRMMRLASQHSRAASNAFQRGDHHSAHQLSLKARGEWISAEKLNAKAAEQILRIRNCNNDVWKLDLHGLHASEAVNALKEHLHRIETHVPAKHSVSADGMHKLEKEARCDPSLATDSGLDMEIPSSKPQAFIQQRHTVLHVITGNGNHSKGQAALPTAVRSFLIDNGYRFDDVRTGVIAVRPKFRHSSPMKDVLKTHQCC